MMRARNSSLLCVVCALAVTCAVLVLLFVGTHTDHAFSCQQHPDYAHMDYFRSVDSFDYGTKVSAPYARTRAGDNYDWSGAPDAANVSEALCANRQRAPQYGVPAVSNLFWVWGQFLAHCVALSDTNHTKTMYVGAGLEPSHPTYELVDAYGVTQQLNGLSPYLDASAVYGYEREQARQLRKHDGSGKLRASESAAAERGALLPLDESGEFVTGDPRARENVLLSAMHVLWLREHNWWCERLRDEHPSWDGDRLYGTARHLVMGEIQSITYNEWLPLLLGTRKLTNQHICYRNRYVSVLNEFATAGFRIGHSMVTDHLEARHPETGVRQPQLELSLLEAFFQHSANGSLAQHGIAAYLLGGARQQAELLDTHIVDTLRVVLFGNHRMDLAALNVARGRQHGLPSFQQLYNVYNAHRGATATYTSHLQLTDSPTLRDAVLQTYGDWSQPIDLWIGLLAERKRHGALLGEVGARLVSDQFEAMRASDPYYYHWDRVVSAYRPELHSTRLSTVLLRNTRISRSQLRPEAFRIQ